MFQIGQRVFQPTLIPTLVTIALLPCLLWLGFWQLDRAEEKKVLLNNFENSQNQPAVDISSFPNIEQLSQYQKIKMTGTFDIEHQFLLDNKVHRGKAGYFVITPLLLSNSSQRILINRGWLPQGENRQDLPPIPTPQATQTIFGQVKLNAGSGFNLGGDMLLNADWPRVVQSENPAVLAKYLGYDIEPFVVLLDAKSDAGFIRDWYIKKIVPEKSVSYAVQWFSLALALFIIYFVVTIRKVTTGTDHGA